MVFAATASSDAIGYTHGGGPGHGHPGCLVPQSSMKLEMALSTRLLSSIFICPSGILDATSLRLITAISDETADTQGLGLGSSPNPGHPNLVVPGLDIMASGWVLGGMPPLSLPRNGL